MLQIPAMHNVKHSSMADRVLSGHYPCVMAHTVFSQNHVRVISSPDMTDLRSETVKHVLGQIYDAIEFFQGDKGYHSILLQFDEPFIHCEHQFETLLWNLLQALHDEDSKSFAWNEKVESDPGSVQFSFSLMGKAFYIIGMHPKSSRRARQSPKPMLVLNPHEQFEKIRATGNYAKVRDKIRRLDIAYSGTRNPMADDFGNTSEALQYSGRQVDKESWRCPFRPRNQKTTML